MLVIVRSISMMRTGRLTRKPGLKVHAQDIGQEGRVRLVYVVKSGDVPGGIALKFNVRLADLKYWNNLDRRMTIRPGQKLVVYVPEIKRPSMPVKLLIPER